MKFAPFAMVKGATTLGINKKPVGAVPNRFLYLILGGSPISAPSLSERVLFRLSHCGVGHAKGWAVIRYRQNAPTSMYTTVGYLVRGFTIATAFVRALHYWPLTSQRFLLHLSGTHNTTSPCGFSEALPRSAPRGFAAPLDIISIPHCQPKVKCF